jgi:hypothetical protein
VTAHAEGGLLCDPSKHYCGSGGQSTRSGATAAYPSNSGKVSVNPSAVPVTKQLGVELIVYKGTFDPSVITGTGRIGAAISPTGSEETFFGPIGFEVSQDLLKRRLIDDKYASQKVGLASAVSLFSNSASGLNHFELNLGVMGKYNRLTGTAWPGGGVSGVAGPLSFGYAAAKDEFLFDYSPYSASYPGNALKQKFRYALETYSIGLSLTNLSLDYSLLKVTAEEFTEPATVALLVASLTVKQAMFTVAARTERSDREYFDPSLKTLVTKKVKNETFLGVQGHFGKAIMVGLFYNYYTLHELSFGLTAFL